MFDWTVDRCAMDDIPDLPARAFRDAHGRVQLLAAHPENRRMVGPSLDALRRDCQVVLSSDRDSDPANFNGWEWIAAPYTPDGQTVYALIHNEYHGNEAGQWSLKTDFFDLSAINPVSTQGRKGWFYQEFRGGYRHMRYDANNRRWQGSRPLCQIAEFGMHPDQGCEPSLKWVSPKGGHVTVIGNVRDLDGGGGDGVTATIHKDGRELWRRRIENGDEQGHGFELEVEVEAGDALYFRINARGDASFDATGLDVSIVFGTHPCPSGEPFRCWVNAITLARSTDGGESYAHTEPPEHLVASAPYRYEPDSGPWGVFAPSNIVKHPTDGYYYALVRTGARLLQRSGLCVMRTDNLADPKSWRAWDGEGFNVRFADPYRTGAPPSDHVCNALSFNTDTIPESGASLTYNTFLEQFILVGAGRWWDEMRGIYVPGFYYTLSNDLIHWSKRQLILEGKLPWFPDWPGEVILYPSLIDPDDPSRNFERTGQSPYLYFTRFRPCTPQNLCLDRDLVRIRLMFLK